VFKQLKSKPNGRENVKCKPNMYGTLRANQNAYERLKRKPLKSQMCMK